jgi:hypothetical protein
MRQNYFLDLLAVDSPSASSSGNTSSTLEHDPEKTCPALDAGWVPVFHRDKREAFARRSCSNKKIERDDDSKKSHPALALRTLPTLLSTVQIFSHSGAELHRLSAHRAQAS